MRGGNTHLESAMHLGSRTTTHARSIALARAAVGLAIAGVSLTAAATPAVEFAPSANIQYEWAHLDTDSAYAGDEDGFRRARLGFRIKDHAGRWQFVAEHDFADMTPPDAYLELTPAKGHSVRVGQFKQPFLLEDAISDKNSPLLEQSLLGAFGISRRIGIEYAHAADWGTLNTAVFGQRLDGTSESLGASSRGTWLLRSDERETVHVGVSLATESPDNEHASFKVTPGTSLTDPRLGSTGTLTAVDRLDRAGLEGLWIRNAWSLQGEVAQVTAHRPGEDFHGHASSVLMTWSPSGDGRSYKRGVVGAPTLDGAPVWELALRWSAIDLDDGSVAGGRVSNVGIGATCYISKHARVIANVVKFDRRGFDDNPTVAGVRVQLTY